MFCCAFNYLRITLYWQCRVFPDDCKYSIPFLDSIMPSHFPFFCCIKETLIKYLNMAENKQALTITWGFHIIYRCTYGVCCYPFNIQLEEVPMSLFTIMELYGIAASSQRRPTYEQWRNRWHWPTSAGVSVIIYSHVSWGINYISNRYTLAVWAPHQHIK